VRRAHVAPAQVRHVRLDVAGRPGEVGRLFAERPGDLQRGLVERREQLAARAEHHVIERELLLRRIDQEDADPDAVGQLGGPMQDELGPVGRPMWHASSRVQGWEATIQP